MAVLEIAVVLILVALNGLFALSELAVVSARRSRLRALEQEGRKGATSALELASEPGRFLSTVQIGITVVGLAAGAYSGATLTNDLESILIGYGVPDGFADWLSYIVVFACITYLSLIIGELVPKNLALSNAEAIACAVAPLMSLLSRMAAPAVWLLDTSTRAVFALLRRPQQPQSTVTEEEIKGLIAEAESAGVLESGEHRLISGVLRLGDRPISGLMTPRTEVGWVDITESQEAIVARIIASPHSRMPVGEGSIDKLIGVLRTHEPLAALATGQPLDLRAYVRKAPIVPETMDALDALEMLQQAAVPMALIHDEYGNFEGLVVPADILEAIAGMFRSNEGGKEPAAVSREGGSWLLAGWMPADEMADQLGITLPPKRDYQTVAGFVLAHLKHLPATGESVDVSGWRFEVADLDGRRIDKVLASRTPLWRRGGQRDSTPPASS